MTPKLHHTIAREGKPKGSDPARFMNSFAWLHSLLRLLSGLVLMPSMVTHSEEWTNVYPNGSTDVNGKVMWGIQMMFLVPHKGKLYAANGTQGETNTTLYPQQSQVLVLDSPNGNWRVDGQFSLNQPRVNQMQSLTFTTDVLGNVITPQNILLAAPSDNTKRFAVYTRNDNNGFWVRTANFLVPNTDNFMPRAMTLYHDPVTETDNVYVGVRGGGVYRGGYDLTATGRIAWNTTPEFAPPGEYRITAFAEANGQLFCSVSSADDLTLLDGRIYRRTVNGTNPVWELIHITEDGLGWEDVRGLTGVPNPNGPGEVLVFTWNGKIFRLDPSQSPPQAVVECDINAVVADNTGLTVSTVVAAYNEFVPVTLPGETTTSWLVGLHTYINTAQHPDVPVVGNVLADGAYLIRRQSGTSVSYEYRYILRNYPAMVDPLMTVRHMCVSPFPEDEGKVLYACGLDHSGNPMSLAAWIYRGDFRKPPVTLDITQSTTDRMLLESGLTQPGYTYTLERSTDLGAWEPEIPDFRGNGLTHKRVIHFSSGPRRFFRLRMTPTP